jgi:glycerol kinase
MAVDQGTTGTTVLVFDQAGLVRGRATRELPQIYPRPGWVEHDALVIWDDVLATMQAALASAGAGAGQVAAIGITNQRETVVCWDRRTGRPEGNAIVWQDRRTADFCQELITGGAESLVQQKTGLLIDPYFSGTKIRWMLDQDSSRRARAERGELLAGTIESWLIWQLSGGTVHATDVSNASRSLLYDIHQLRWEDQLLDMMQIPRQMLPRVVPSSGEVARTASGLFGGASIPISGMAGDQQAALFGQACFQLGRAKNTYGTGSFLLMNTGPQPVASSQRLLTTIAWQLGDAPVEYALEGAVFICGAAVQWLRDGLGVIQTAAESEPLARSLPDNDGVYFVPALAGLGAPYWDPYARGTIVGLTRGSGAAHLARAALEAICYQTRDVVEAMARDTGLSLQDLRADGGAVANQFLMQFQADILGVPVRVPRVAETTALGAAFLAGLGVGFWQDRDQIEQQWVQSAQYDPQMDSGRRDELYQGWKQAVQRARHWARPAAP